VRGGGAQPGCGSGNTFGGEEQSAWEAPPSPRSPTANSVTHLSAAGSKKQMQYAYFVTRPCNCQVPTCGAQLPRRRTQSTRDPWSCNCQVPTCGAQLPRRRTQSTRDPWSCHCQVPTCGAQRPETWRLALKVWPEMPARPFIGLIWGEFSLLPKPPSRQFRSRAQRAAGRATSRSVTTANASMFASSSRKRTSTRCVPLRRWITSLSSTNLSWTIGSK
jgi:hypothetical protein